MKKPHSKVVSTSSSALSSIMLMSYEGRLHDGVDDFLQEVSCAIGEGVLLDLHHSLVKKYGMPHLGTSRVCYVSKSVVFKVPISPDGFYHNDAEASLISTDWIEADCLAKTRLIFVQDIPVVAMEYITDASPQEIRNALGEIPDWVYAIDMAQVGFAKNGKLKAYDYADLMSF